MKVVSRRAIEALLLTSGLISTSSGLALAETAETADLEEILVTGERTERSIMETASSVAVFDQKRLVEHAGSDRIEQMLDAVTNLQRGSSDIGPAIRGQDTTGVLIGANAFLGGTRPRATLQMDGRALNFNEFVYGLSSIWDVERIEVFRGPQTTTQGRNAIAGAIFINTKNPTFDFEGAGRVIVGSDETRQASIALSGPLLDDQLAGRLSVDWRQHESWMNYLGPEVFVGANREDDDYVSARGKLLFTPTAIPELELLLSYSHLDANNPQNETADVPYDSRIQAVQNGAQWDTEVDTLVLNASYQFSEAWEGELIASYADSRSERFAPPGAGSALTTADEYAIEGLLRFDQADSGVRGLMGIAYFYSHQDESSDLSAFLGFGDFTDKQHSLGVFAELSLDLSSALHLTLGGRWQEDSQDRIGSLGFVSLDYHENFSAFMPKFELAYDVSEELVVGLSARKGFNPGGTTISFATGAIDDFKKETLWNYEIFTRANFLDGELLVLANAFYTDFKDSQRQLIDFVTLPNGLNAEFAVYDNAPSAKSYGLELESTWSPNEIIQLRAAMGFLETEITKTLLPGDPILGKEFQRAPGFSANIGLTLRPVEQLSLNLNARHYSSYFSDDANTAAFEIDGETLLDLNARYDFGSIDVFAYVHNATDETYQVWQFRPGNSSLGDPREYGLGVEVSF